MLEVVWENLKVQYLCGSQFSQTPSPISIKLCKYGKPFFISSTETMMTIETKNTIKSNQQSQFGYQNIDYQKLSRSYLYFVTVSAN